MTAPAQLLQRFLAEIGPKLRPPRLTRQILKKFADKDVDVRFVLESVGENQYYARRFECAAAELAREGEKLGLENAVLRMGMINVRNQLCAMQLKRHVDGGHLEPAAPGADPSTALRYALACEDAVASRKPPIADTAFAAGMIFDTLAALASGPMKSPADVVSFVDEVFRHGLRTARIGLEVGKLLPDAPHAKHVFAACLLHDAGKAALAMLEPGYVAFAARIREAALPRPARHLLERREFGLAHDAISALCAGHVPQFEPVREALLFHHEPYLLVAGSREQWLLTSITCLAVNMAHDLRVPGGTGDPLLAKWKGRDVGALAVTASQLIAIAAKLSRVA